jgi:cellulose synthase/poly-beta-1,6-N-acetylglucosamine synthase-like glycosyltransferase
MTQLLATAPWLLLIAALPFLLRQRPSLSAYPPLPDGRTPRPDGRTPRPGNGTPLVSIIVPTHDDARRVGASLSSLLDSDYEAYEVVVVDADSTDGTREIVAALEERAPGRVRLLDAGVAPVGRSWHGWACWRGYGAARGELLLFTSPGTLHDSQLLGRAVAALAREEADLVSVYPRLTMQGFWERLIMPHIWFVLTARLPTAASVNRWQDPADAVATQHFMLFRRDAYEAVGGHERVAERDPEAATLARAVLHAGRRLFLVHGEDYLEARMYRTLGAIADELTTATPLTSRLTLPGWARTAVAWLVAATPVLFFVAPPLIMVGTVLGAVRGPPAVWALWTTALSLLFWLLVYARHRIRPAYAVAYPAGALVSSLIFARGILLQER